MSIMYKERIKLLKEKIQIEKEKVKYREDLSGDVVKLERDILNFLRKHAENKKKADEKKKHEIKKANVKHTKPPGLDDLNDWSP